MLLSPLRRASAFVTDARASKIGLLQEYHRSGQLLSKNREVMVKLSKIFWFPLINLFFENTF